ncbi:MAG: hypothetical protein IKS19_04335 [Clostridia bacterium]|nr:hypothetical protein [Clostridia bacterium]
MKMLKKMICMLLASVCILFTVGFEASSAATDKITAYGIDVSSWQGLNVDWKKVKASGIDFAIIRCGTSNIVDKAFEINYKNAKAAGVDLGCYIYTYQKSVDGAKKDAKKVLDLIKGKKFEYPIYFDIEDPSLDSLSTSTRTNMCLAFCDMLSKEGWMTGVYASTSYFRDKLNKSKISDRYEIWTAWWKSSRKPDSDMSDSCGLWQYSAKGSVKGITGYVDLDVSYRNYPGIIKKKGLNGYKAEDDPVGDKYKAGDCDMDGKITSSDSLLILKAVIGSEKLKEEQIKLADVDSDGIVTSTDALIVLKMSIGIINSSNPV